MSTLNLTDETTHIQTGKCLRLFESDDILRLVVSILRTNFDCKKQDFQFEFVICKLINDITFVSYCQVFRKLFI